LVRLADNDKRRASHSSKVSTYLTEEEIMGNLFAFTIAGYETTSTTLAYAVMMLAIDPEWQDWIVHEIDKVTSLHPEADYASIFPLLTRCLALMVRFVCTFT
jgi:cytochrome P450